MNTPNRRRILDRIGAWVARNVAETGRPDHPARPGHVDPAQIASAAEANRDYCNDRHDSTEQAGVFFTCTLTPGHVGPHECRISGPSPRLLSLWVAGADARRDEWLKTVGATDPESPIYFEALAAWEAAREYEAKRTSFREAPGMVSEIEAHLSEVAR
jgi:hypothetical protein